MATSAQSGDTGRANVVQVTAMNDDPSAMSPPSADQLLVLLRSHETAWRLRVSGDLLHLITPLRQDALPLQRLRPAPAPRRR